METTPPSASAGISVGRLTVLDEDADETPYRLHRRFDRLGRMYGDGAVQRLMATRVAVFGLGGVGSFAAEGLVRSAVGALTLIDFDEVCVTNTNRQLQALKGNIGQPKALVLQERLRRINPQARIEAVQSFYKAETSEALLSCPWDGQPYDYVVDCIDNLSAKAHLIATCKARGIELVSSMGAAGKRDPTRVRVADLARTHGCPMAREMRSILRKKHGFPKRGEMGVTAVYSDEKRSWPRELTYDNGEGFRCVCPKKHSDHSCDNRNLIDGTVAFVTGTFGLVCAGRVVDGLVSDLIATSLAAKPNLAARAAALNGAPSE